MDILESIKVSIDGLKSNKLRSFLTMLGIIIGISSVIAITTIGRAMSNSVQKAFDEIGNNSIQISLTSKEGFGWDSIDYSLSFTPEALEDLKEHFSNSIKYITVEGPGLSGNVKSGSEEINISATSTTEGQKEVAKIKIKSGRFLQQADDRDSKYVCVISDELATKLYGNNLSKALGRELDMDSAVFTVIGVYEKKAENFGPLSVSEGGKHKIYIPLSTGRLLNNVTDDSTSYAVISLYNGNNSEEQSKLIENYLNEKYFKDSETTKVQAMSFASQMKEINTSMRSVKLAISTIAGISLLVGGIGVMNILLVSVTERTREIGIRKALGATRSDIRRQFIIESIIICIIGGILGIILGGALGFAGSILLKAKTLPSIISIIIAVGFSMMIGIFFGYYPANKAAKLDPIEALRYE